MSPASRRRSASAPIPLSTLTTPCRTSTRPPCPFPTTSCWTCGAPRLGVDPPTCSAGPWPQLLPLSQRFPGRPLRSALSSPSLAWRPCGPPGLASWGPSGSELPAWPFRQGTPLRRRSV
uniref:Uncharacterized protein n=1 Tax=Ixodes ricinus TaxID=34613 RepID=A0A6B0UM28_IXORI